MDVAKNIALPVRVNDVDELEEILSCPSPALADDLATVTGNLMVLGVGGKMGPTLARMAKRAAPEKRVMGVARFSSPGLREQLEAWDIECLSADLLEPTAVNSLPRCENVIFMAGHKFGSAGASVHTWATNVILPYLVAEAFRESRIVAFSTACVYPYVDVRGTGADEGLATCPPPGDYSASCVGREQMFQFCSDRYRTPGRLLRLSYATELRYGVLHDIACKICRGVPIDLTMGYVNIIWQGDANEQALRSLRYCTTPTSAINISGPILSVRWLAEELGKRLGKSPRLVGHEADDAWLVDTSKSHELFGPIRVPVERMLDWVAAWVSEGKASLDKQTHFETRDGKF